METAPFFLDEGRTARPRAEFRRKRFRLGRRIPADPRRFCETSDPSKPRQRGEGAPCGQLALRETARVFRPEFLAFEEKVKPRSPFLRGASRALVLETGSSVFSPRQRRPHDPEGTEREPGLRGVAPAVRKRDRAPLLAVQEALRPVASVLPADLRLLLPRGRLALSSIGCFASGRYDPARRGGP